MMMINGIMVKLGIEHVNIRIMTVSEIWDWNDVGKYARCARGTMGICEPMDDGFNIRVVDDHDRDVTIAHELYHVFQHVYGYELNETLAEMFGQMYA